MKRIRTKLVLALVAIAILPVLPVYHLVSNLLQKSIEVGYNENVEISLDNATRLSQKLFATYRHQALRRVAELSRADWVQDVFLSRRLTVADTTGLRGSRIDFFDLRGRLMNTVKIDPNGTFPRLFETDLAPLSKRAEPAVVDGVGGRDHVLAMAPVMVRGERRGFLVLTQPVDEEFRRMSSQIIRVNQMFKTLDFFESELTSWFILSFLAVYIPIALLSVGLGVYFSRRLTRPLMSLVEGTQKVAEGDWDYRIPVTSRDEIGDVTVAFNRMVATLKEKQDQVIALEKMAAWREIARVLAHEIKNPLTPIQLTVQQLKDKYPGGNQEYQKLLNECTGIICDEIESLRALVREFSEFARMPKLNVEQGDINELVAEVGKLYPAVGVRLHPRPLVTAFDYEKMRRVLINLIDNGMDSIREKGAGELTLETSGEADKVRIAYADTGIGIPEALQEKIFEPYFSTKKSGMGLGLAIVKRIIVEHGGEISMQSEAGQGVTFVIDLPVSNRC